MVTGVRDRLLLHDPCFTRLIFASRAVLGLAAGAIIGWLLAREMGHDLSGVLLGLAGAQFTLLLAREPSRATRITTSFLMIPGYWLGLIIVHVVADQPYGSRVTASHTCAMGSYNDHYCSRLFRLLKKSGLRFLSMPTERLHLQGRFDGYPKRRGLTRVPELLDAGLKVAFGQASIRDPWYPLGHGNMLRTLDVGLHACHMLGMSWIEHSLELITDNGAAALDLKEYGIAEGMPARCVVLQGQSPYEVLLGQQPVLASIRDVCALLGASPRLRFAAAPKSLSRFVERRFSSKLTIRPSFTKKAPHMAGLFCERWPARQDSNLRPLPPEGTKH